MIVIGTVVLALVLGGVSYGKAANGSGRGQPSKVQEISWTVTLPATSSPVPSVVTSNTIFPAGSLLTVTSGSFNGPCWGLMVTISATDALGTPETLGNIQGGGGGSGTNTSLSVSATTLATNATHITASAQCYASNLTVVPVPSGQQLTTTLEWVHGGKPTVIS
jgi:hypothetical protein